MLYSEYGREEPTERRAALESTLSADMRAFLAQSDDVGRSFADLHSLSLNDFHALLHIMVAETSGSPLTAGQLRQRMSFSGAAITYLVERMIAAGHISRESDPDDRRKVILRYRPNGMTMARAFFTPLGSATRAAMAELPDEDLAAAHRVFTALNNGMRLFSREHLHSTGAEPSQQSWT